MALFATKHQLTALALVGSGFSRFTRNRRKGQACVLTFHGLREDHGVGGSLDSSLHMPVSTFRNVCQHLAAKYRVVSLSRIVESIRHQRPLSDRTVAITFDDGYESNYRLAGPVLREFDLPATIFACTGFMDRTETPVVS